MGLPNKERTIAAIATPIGEGGVAIIRISGKEALFIADQVFSGPVHTYQTHTAHLGKIVSKDGSVIDQALLLVMRSPRSYTGEDTVEIHCHGGSFIAKKVLECVIEAGAESAHPGEFTQKAFLNGKIDLAQAEAVQQLIGAKNALALQIAEQQLEGKLSKTIASFQKELVDIAAILEAWVDFPEEDLEFASMDEVINHLLQLKEKMQQLSSTFHEGKMIHEGIALCLIGLPNVGKSSLMNALLGKERAIVTEIAGTTRDLLEESLRLGNLHFSITDTAGIRQTEEIIEKEGIRRSKKAMEYADLILLILDATEPISLETQELINSAPKDKTLFVYNKIDLKKEKELFYEDAVDQTVFISAKQGWGLEELKKKIETTIYKKGLPSKEEVLITNARHHEALQLAIQGLGTLIENLKTQVSAEFVSSDMRFTLDALGRIIGMNITEEILSAIFSKFCIGK